LLFDFKCCLITVEGVDPIGAPAFGAFLLSYSAATLFAAPAVSTLKDSSSSASTSLVFNLNDYYVDITAPPDYFLICYLTPCFLLADAIY
jgi:hypothetical protein